MERYLFENAFQENWKLFERVFDTELKKSIVREVDTKAEYYVECDPTNPRAHYSFILDQSRKFEKQTRSKKGMSEEFGYTGAIYRHIRDNYWNKDLSHTLYNTKPNYWALDIETRSGVVKSGFPRPDEANEEITMFQIYDKELDIIILFGTKEFKHHQYYLDKFNEKYQGKDSVKDIKFIQCENEIDMINKYLKLFKVRDPLAIYAWNGDGFDFPYMYNRFKNLGYDKNVMSNHGKVSYKEGEFQGQITYTVKAASNNYIDLMKVFDKFTFTPQSSLALDHIAEVELGEHKVDHSEYVRFDDFYSGNYTIPHNPTQEQKDSEIYKAAIDGRFDDVRELSYSSFCYYGAIDTYLLERLIRKHLFHDIMVNISSKMGVLLSDAMGTVKPWSTFLSNVCYEAGLIMPPKEEHDHPQITGGFVRDPVTGLHKWVLASDVNSMYPLLGIAAFNMSPETYISKKDIPDEIRDLIMKYYPDQNESNRLDMPVEIHDHISSKLKELNLSLGINGALFSQEKLGIIPEMVLEIYTGRKVDKGTQFKYEQKKILLSELLEHRQQKVA